MNRRLNYGLVLVYNLVRIQFNRVIHFRKFHSTPIQLLSPRTEIEIIGNGQMRFSGRVHSEAFTKLSVGNSGELQIGDNVYLNRNSIIVCRRKITIGSGTTIGPNVAIFDHDHDFINHGRFTFSDIYIGKNVWIGSNCVILKGITIGDNSVVGAGTILTHDVKENTLIHTKFSYSEKEIIRK